MEQKEEGRGIEAHAASISEYRSKIDAELAPAVDYFLLYHGDLSWLFVVMPDLATRRHRPLPRWSCTRLDKGCCGGALVGVVDSDEVACFCGLVAKYGLSMIGCMLQT
jgi:hypothetical protein